MNGATLKAGLMFGRIHTATEALKLIHDGRNNGHRPRVDEIRKILEQRPVEVCIKFIPEFVME